MPLEQNRENSEPTPSQIIEALRLILRSARFSGSKQCQTLLQYLVEHSLSGQDDELKERIFALHLPVENLEAGFIDRRKLSCRASLFCLGTQAPGGPERLGELNPLLLIVTATRTDKG